MPLKIYIDADACPVREETYKVARRHNVEVIVVSNSFIRVPREPGISLQIVSDNFDAADDNQNQVFRMNKWTNFYEVGFGIDLYLEYFKFSPSIRGVFSLNDELIQDNNPGSPWTSNIDTFTTRGVFINFTFH